MPLCDAIVSSFVAHLGQVCNRFIRYALQLVCVTINGSSNKMNSHTHVAQSTIVCACVLNASALCFHVFFILMSS